MYYEVYVDVLFVKNLWMNALLLLLTVWAEQERAGLLKILAGACMGSLGACMLTVFSAYLSGSAYFLGTLLLAAGMTWVTFGGGRRFPFRLIALYIEGFVLNGMLRYLEQFHPLAGVWFGVFSGMSVLALLGVQAFWRYREKQRGRNFPVVLQHGGCELLVEALYDTGNGLYDPISKSAVSILDQTILKELLEESGRENLPRVIPYRTISESGILEAYVLDRMIIRCPKEERVLERPLLAGMPGKSEQYQLILHRDLLTS